MSRSIIIKECNKLRKIGFEVQAKHLRFNWKIGVYMNKSDIPKIVRYLGYEDRFMSLIFHPQTIIYDHIRVMSFHLSKNVPYRSYIMPDVNILMGEIECPIEIIKRGLYTQQLNELISEISKIVMKTQERIYERIKEETHGN